MTNPVKTCLLKDKRNTCVGFGTYFLSSKGCDFISQVSWIYQVIMMGLNHPVLISDILNTSNMTNTFPAVINLKNTSIWQKGN